MFSILLIKTLGYLYALKKFDSMKPFAIFEINLLKLLLAKIKLINFEINSDIENPKKNFFEIQLNVIQQSQTKREPLII